MKNHRNKDLFVYQSFNNKVGADKAFHAATELGYKPEEINVLMSEDTRTRYYSHDTAEKEAAQNLTIGGLLGGTIGGTIGALIALGSNIALPGLGLVIAGPLVGAGGVYGGLLGSLLGWSSPKEEELPNANDLPNAFNDSLKKGSIVLLIEENPTKPSIKPIWESIKKEND